MNKFSICIQNPPFGSNMHLKFIRKCIEISDILINISPSGFLNDIGCYNTKLKYHNDDIIKHLYNVEIIGYEEGNNIFNISTFLDLHIGIYKHDYNDGEPFIDKELNKIYRKIRYRFKTNFRRHFVNKDKLREYGVRIGRMLPTTAYFKPIKPYYEYIIRDKGNTTQGINFNTKEELDNFRKSIHLWPYNFMYKCNDINPAHLPYLDDYTHEYTNEELYEIFNITEEEKKIIEKVINEI